MIVGVVGIPKSCISTSLYFTKT